MPKTKVLICPYCGETQPAGDRCKACGGLFEALSRQASHNAMGPWFVREGGSAFQPGCSYETLTRLIERGRVEKYSIVRGPTTKQFWTVAKRVPGIAHLFGYCHHCDASVDPGDHGCHACGVPFGAYLDRNYLGLPDVRPLPWEADIHDDGDAIMSRSRADSLSFSRAGLSSFASDDELLRFDVDEPAAPTAAARGLSSDFPTADAPSVEERAPEAAPPANDYEATIYSLRRRLARARRTNTILIALVIVLGGGVATLLASLTLPSNPLAPNPQPVVEPRFSSPGQPADADRNDEAAPGPDEAGAAAAPVEDRPTGGTASDETASDETGSTPVAPAPPRFDLAADLEQIEALTKSAEEIERDLEDRIGDLELAIELLKRIRDSGLEAAPADVDERLQRLGEMLERLEVKRFFPDG